MNKNNKNVIIFWVLLVFTFFISMLSDARKDYGINKPWTIRIE